MKLSVAMCTYNGDKFIASQLSSILEQTIPVDEIVICDDGSNDKTLEIISRIQQENPNKINLFRNPVNLGSTKNFEKAIDLCSGDYIFLADQDDIWKKDKVQKILDVFDQNPNAEGVFSNADLIDENSNLISSMTIWDTVFFLEKELPKPIDFFNVVSKNGNIVTGATLCIRKHVKDFITNFKDDVLHDEKIATLLILRKSLYYSSENLISYRIHNKQQVGMKNMYKLVHKNRMKRIILDLEKPSSFLEYRHLSKKKYLKFHKSKKYQKFNSIKIDIQDLITKSHTEFHDLNIKMKLKFPIRYRFVMISDRLLGKRKK
ncbi:glycosyltransferase family 2 protein [Flavobacterium sp. M31R6]|uniref:glycosyltransferase family 2 protein n=1 Tax=Flavobacterium sp. M31R6 TaxID=2739062 RepID=UPI001567CB43|nr:glycosyltransferase family 2 protein [Flavobacterium sp. M31R6]QKJ64405.1 glycosyltransferase family 2 protein [Flavobacterium sp. M31R6]